MTLNFDFGKVTLTEFGVGRDDDDGRAFVAVPVDTEVQAVLREMAVATWEAMQKDAKDPAKYEPSEKHGGTEYLYLPLDDDLAASVRDLHTAENLPLDFHALADPDTVFCYFARMTDNKARRLTALRRAAQFKGVLKSRGRLMRLADDSLRIIDEPVFRLDNDFDILMDSASVHILRPGGFEFAGNLQRAILEAVPQNVRAIQKDLAFVDFASIEQYASKHPRAARYLSSIRGAKETKNVDRKALRELCASTGVDVTESKGMIFVAAGHEIGFLEVLDRRRYRLELVRGQPERFKATSRRKIDG